MISVSIEYVLGDHKVFWYADKCPALTFVILSVYFFTSVLISHINHCLVGSRVQKALSYFTTQHLTLSASLRRSRNNNGNNSIS